MTTTNPLFKRLTGKVRGLFGADDGAEHGSEVVLIPRDQHNISRKNISKSALKVLYRLDEAGYAAFIVGGGVRDLLLDLRPKDFDIATNATPEQVKELFRNCRLVGRRFRLAHILFGREVIEVATFRSGDLEHPHRQTGSEGLVLRDNVFGSIEEDAWRRDFTVNALYYNIADFSVLDFCGGMADLDDRLMHIIGDPEQRYREDPVRMLRALRLACKLDLDLSVETADPIPELADLLSQVSPARLWDECGKLFLAGHARATWDALYEYGLLAPMFPQTWRSLQHDESGAFSAFIEAALDNTDARIADGKPVTPAFLFAVFLWQPLQDLVRDMQQRGTGYNEAVFKAAGKVLAVQNESVSVPRRFGLVIRDIWALQIRLPARHRHKSLTTFSHPRFRAGYDFLLLRSAAEPELRDLVDWWTRFQEVDEAGQKGMLEKLPAGKGRRKRRPKRKPAASKGQS